MKNAIRKSVIIWFMIVIVVVGGMQPIIANASTENVAKLTIFSDGSGKSYGTHSFLYIKNISSGNIKILGNILSPKEGMTVGTFGNKNEGKGIYINLEALYIKEHGTYQERVSLTTSLTKAEVVQLEI